MESIFKTEPEQRLLALCEEHLGPLGYRAVDVDCRIAGRSLIRLFVEKLSDSGPEITLDNCAEVSRKLEEVLDADPLVPGGYDLEVSSPGLDRRLRLQDDFEKSVGSELKLKLVESREGLGSAVRGRLNKVDHGTLHLRVSGKEVALPLGAVSRANRVFEMK